MLPAIKLSKEETIKVKKLMSEGLSLVEAMKKLFCKGGVK